MNYNIYALHGFLGQSSDWNFLDTYPIDVFSLQGSLDEAGAQVNQMATTNNNFLLGYSLGGRIALHALIQNPKQWKGAILISANPGLKTDQEITTRAAKDLQWQNRFLNDPWDDLMKQWNDQPVFNGDSIHRKESDFDRKTLAETFSRWTVANQINLITDISQIPIPILWIAGKEDQKYSAIAKEINLLNPVSKVWIAEGASHRVPWQQQLRFKQEMVDFINSVLEEKL